MTSVAWLVVAGCLGLVGCGGGSVGTSSGGTGDDDDDIGGGEGEGEEPGEGEGEAELEAEICDGFDNDGDGQVDDGCTCDAGATQDCYPGEPAEAGVGICAAGTQTCEEGFEFAEWAECVGFVGPEEESCGNALDDDCDGEADEDCGCTIGEERPCYPGEAGEVGVGICAEGTETCIAGDVGDDENEWSDCEGARTPQEEVCGNGTDEDCDGADLECEGPIVIELDIEGDCVYASCPDEAPFPIACNITFEGGDERGCVAYVPGSSDVYFQEGNVCNAGHLSGTMTCSTEPGAGLNEDNCPINKEVQYYESDPDDCPD